MRGGRTAKPSSDDSIVGVSGGEVPCSPEAAVGPSCAFLPESQAPTPAASTRARKLTFRPLLTSYFYAPSAQATSTSQLRSSPRLFAAARPPVEIVDLEVEDDDAAAA